MPDDPKLSLEEERRALQREEIRDRVDRQVKTEVAAMADRTAPIDAAEIDRVALGMHGKAVREVVATEREVERARGIARVSQVVDYLFYVVYAFLGVRLLLALLAARPEAGFVQWIATVTDPLYAPFRGIFPNVTVNGGYTFALPLAFAIAMYAILHALILAFLRMFAHRRVAV
jgi:uncharacterized protein YggT (Ycf19 family)